jgi:hypothetical protein
VPRERPAWYLWLRDLPGAWQLELAAAGALDAVGAVVGRFTVRHYPAPEAPELARFSQEERRLVATALDPTGTPRIELAATIPEALFTVGTVDWVLDPDSDAAVFGVASLDRLRTRAGAGELVRDVPGWRLAVPVLSVVAGLHAQVERRAATRIGISRLPGFESAEAGESRDAPDVAFGEAFVAFPGPRGDRARAIALLEALRDEDGEVLHEVDCGERARELPLDSDPRLAFRVSQGWFGGERHRHDRALCAC